MNRYLYRIVFNKKTGAYTAVAELTSVHGKSASACMCSNIQPVLAMVRPAFTLRRAGLALGIVALCGNLTSANAQIVAYRQAPGNQQATILQTGNGVPLVNIQTPNAQGVSRNVYSQFDVDSKGVILNNARNSALTQLGGWVAGNPWLATGAARVIVNEINSSNPSYLRGYVEVAGKRADVVIANPSGLFVGNAGFINAARAAVTTANPVPGGGNLDAYRVSGGVVTIDKNGLDLTSTDYAAIMARAVRVNASIWAKNLKVTTGVNDVSADHSVVTPPAGAKETADPAPGFAIDVAQLGGMYAGKIFLVGTEHGVGMRNAGTIGAVGGDLIINSEGRLENKGKLLADKTLDVKAAAIDNLTGAQIIAANNKLRATDSPGLTNRGLIDGATTLIESPAINNLGSGRIYGDHLAATGNTLNNMAETINDVTKAPVIAARERMDLGVAAINNRDHALLYSAGDLFTGNALNSDHQATGMGEVINNDSAAIAADGNGTINHKIVNNRNAHLQTTTEHYPGRRIVQFRLNGSPDKIDGSNVRLVNRGSGQTLAVTDRERMGDEDNFRLVLPSSTYPFVRYGAALLRYAYTPPYSTGGGGDSDVVYHREVYGYQPRDPIWQTMGVTPPTSDTLVGPSPGMLDCVGTVCYNRLNPHYAAWKSAYDQQQASYEALNSAINAFNRNLMVRMVGEWTIYDGTEQIARTKVLRSDPAMINIGGNVHFNSEAVNNANSQIIAGGDASGNHVTGTKPANTGLAGSHIVTTTGRALYTYIKSHRTRSDDRRYDSRPYEGQSVHTRFMLDITPKDVNPAKADKTLSSSPAAAADMVVRTSNPDTSQSDSALHRPGNQRYLIATDPQFANYRNWLSTDYMLTRLGQDPGQSLKRIGDGFHEQQLVQQQIQKAIGQRYAGNHTNNEAQFQALMNAGVQMAQTFDFQLGVALSAEQMARLTSDMVWLVKQTIVLTDGTQEEVLVPQVYLLANRMQVTGEGTLIAANNLQFQTAGDIVNSGTIAAKNTTALSGNNINNPGGRISGTDTLLHARNDINNPGGTFDAVNSVRASAGRDILHRSTTVDTANPTTSGTNIDSVAQVNATGAGGMVTQTAGRDFSADAANISGDTIALVAGRDLRLGTVREKSHEQIQWDKNDQGSRFAQLLGIVRNHTEVSHDNAIGSFITGQHISALAGRNLTSRAATVNAGQALDASAGNHLAISTDTSSASARDRHSHTGSGGWFADKTISTDDASNRTLHQGSTLSGDTVALGAGGNLDITGSDVVSSHGTQVVAQGNVNINAATDIRSSRNDRTETTDGMFDSGFGVTVGTKEQGRLEDNKRSIAAAATVGSTDGKVSISAGNRYTQTGSNVLAPKGDIAISGKQADILAARNTSDTITEHRYQQSGVTVAATGAVIAALQAVQQMDEASGKTKDPRMKALAAATAGLAVANAAASQAAAAASDEGSSGIGLAITAGGSENKTTTEQRSSFQQGSTIAAGGNASIAAFGDKDNSDITIQASKVSAGNTLAFDAEHDLNMLGGEHTDEQRSKRSSASYGAGVAIEFGKNGAAFGVTANAAGSRGKSDGRDVAQVMSHVSGGQQVQFNSGNDSTIAGARVTGKQVIANVGNNLNIASRQDTSTYNSKDQSLGGSVTVGLGFSGSANASYSRVKADFASVGQQSGVEAGDDGFQLNVNGNTDLKGGKIASTDKAVRDSKNTLTTDTLTSSSIANKSQFSAESISVGGGGGDWSGMGGGLPGAGGGLGFDSGSESSTTHSGISDARITINDAAQQEKTGQTTAQTIAGLDKTVRTGKDSSNSLNKNWDGEELNQDVQAQAQITQAFGQQAAKAIGDYAGRELESLEKAAKTAELNGDTAQAAQLNAEAKNWAEGGTYRIAAHAAAGALGGGLAGALGATASAALMPTIAGEINKLDLPEPVRQAVATAAAIGVGAIAGGASGAAGAFNVDFNNRQLHEDNKAKEKTLARNLAGKSNGQYSSEVIENALRGANNNQLGETVLTGAVVPHDAKTALRIHDSTGMISGRAPDGSPLLMQNPTMLAVPPADLQAFIKLHTGNTYSWNVSAPQLPATPLSSLPSIMPGTVTPEMLASRQNNAADFASWIATQSTRFGSAATAYGTYLASQPHPVSQTGAALQFGMAGTATAVGFGAGIMEQLFRPNPGQLAVGGLADVITIGIGKKFPFAGPAINELNETVKASSPASRATDTVNNSIGSKK